MALPIPSMSGVHAFFSHVVEEVDGAARREMAVIAADAKKALEAAKVEALKAETAAAPDINVAIQNAFALAEKELLAALAAHGL